METAAQLELPADRKSARDARRFVATVGGLSSEQMVEVQLVVSELVTNALLHAGLGAADRILLRLARQGRRLRIDVQDPGTFTADSETFDYPEEDHRNHGLRIVQLIADRWEARQGRVTAWLDG